MMLLFQVPGPDGLHLLLRQERLLDRLDHDVAAERALGRDDFVQHELNKSQLKKFFKKKTQYSVP